MDARWKRRTERPRHESYNDRRARVAEAVDVGHGSARGVREVQVLIWRNPCAPLQLRAPQQPLEAYHVAIRSDLDTAEELLEEKIALILQ